MTDGPQDRCHRPQGQSISRDHPPPADTQTLRLRESSNESSISPETRNGSKKTPPTPLPQHPQPIPALNSLLARCCLSARRHSDLENRIEIGVNEEAPQEWNINQVGYHAEKLIEQKLSMLWGVISLICALKLLAAVMAQICICECVKESSRQCGSLWIQHKNRGHTQFNFQLQGTHKPFY